ncbi:hypothetical protein B0T13DRAFT_509096 [Neurospora crassa]|nr:hypothetical protein B0T13DRAFT_509096 [Neurospora crassa]
MGTFVDNVSYAGSNTDSNTDSESDSEHLNGNTGDSTDSNIEADDGSFIDDSKTNFGDTAQMAAGQHF